MSAITLDQIALPIFTTMLANMDDWLAKAQTDALARKFDVNVLMQTRLSPDMLPLTFQIRIACDNAKLGLARMTGADVPPRTPVDETLAQARDRIAATLAYIAGFDPAKVAASADQDVSYPIDMAGTLRTQKGLDYLHSWVLPNFYFHITTAYALLRHNGVLLGKADYLAGTAS